MKTLKEFNKYFLRDALGLDSDWVMRWRLLLEEYGPGVVQTAGMTNTVACYQ